MEAINDLMGCVVRVVHTKEDALQFVDDWTLVKRIAIQRRKVGVSAWVTLRVVNVITSDDLAFTLHDFTARSYNSYEYRAITITTGTEYTTSPVQVDTQFNGALIANKNKGYSCVLNLKFSHQRNYNMSYVMPFNSKYPHSVLNGASNFSKGSIEGYFNPIDASCNIEDKYADFTEEITDFLTDGIPKLLKTPDGHAWYIQIDTPVSIDFKSIFGMVYLRFSWTEVGELPADINKVTAG